MRLNLRKRNPAGLVLVKGSSTHIYVKRRMLKRKCDDRGNGYDFAVVRVGRSWEWTRDEVMDHLTDFIKLQEEARLKNDKERLLDLEAAISDLEGKLKLVEWRRIYSVKIALQSFQRSGGIITPL